MDKYLKKVSIILDKTELSTNSKISYKSNMKKIFVLSKRKTHGFTYLKNIENIKKTINENNLSKSAQKMLYISISQVTKGIPGYKKLSNKYKKISLEITKELNKQYSKNEMTDKQKKTLIPYNDLIEKVKLLGLEWDKKKSKTTKKKYLLGVMYVFSKFTPRLNYSNMKIINEEKLDNDKDNFLLYKNKKYIVILNDYKTKRQYGKIQYELEDKMNNILNKMKVYYQNYLFESNKGGLPMITNNFGVFFKNTFDGITINGIRIIKNNDLIKRKEYVILSTNQQEKLQNILYQHSGFQSITTYRKTDL